MLGFCVHPANVFVSTCSPSEQRFFHKVRKKILSLSVGQCRDLSVYLKELKRFLFFGVECDDGGRRRRMRP